MKLRHKITLTIISTSILLSLVLISLFTFWSKFEIEQKISESIQQQNNQISFQMNQLFNLRTNEVGFLSLELRNNIENKNIKAIDSVIFSARDTFKAYQNIVVFDKSGIKIADTNRIGIGQKFDISNIQNSLKNSNASYIYQNDIDAKNGVLSFSGTILDSQQKLIGYVMGNVPINTFSNSIKEISKTDSLNYQEIDIIKDDGQIIYSNYRNEQLNTFDLAKLVLAKAAIKDSDKTFSLKKKDDIFISFSKSSYSNNNTNSFWYLIIKENKTVAFNKVNRQFFLLSILSLAFIIIASFIAYELAIKITKPIEDAQIAVSEAGRGNFELIQKINATDDEYGELINSLKEMTKKVDYLINEQAIKYRINALGKMAGSIAHEINNPLHLINNHAIILNKTLAREDFHIKNDLDKERIKRSLKSINETVHRISQIISGMKLLSKDSVNDPFENTLINKIVDATLSLCNESIKNKEIDFTINYPSEPVYLQCRSSQIQQALLNLISNAIDVTQFNKEEKWITLDIYKDDQYIIFEVKNSGEKISEEISKNIFTPFYTTKISGHGAGLGLSVVRNITNSHNGMIYIDQNKKNTCFVLKLPLVHNGQKAINSKKAA